MKQRPQWSALIAAARESVGISQERLAFISGVSLGSVKAYEQGRRHPSRPQLVAMMGALKVTRAVRNEVLAAAGFAIDVEAIPDPAIRRLNREDALREVRSQRWPSFLINEHAEILGANVAGRMLWQIEPYGSLFRLGDPAILVATNAEIVKRIINWEEAVAQQIAGWKSKARGTENLDEPSPYFARVIENLQRGDPDVVRRFVDIWDRTKPAFQLSRRWSYSIVWNEPEFGTMKFKCFAWSVNDEDGLDIDDWIPSDAETWVVLDRMLGRARD
jgi:transcriptional regulator with XRE-family HTH domain